MADIRAAHHSGPHAWKYIPISTSHDAYKLSFLPRTIIAWNQLPSIIITAPSLDAFRSRLITPSTQLALVQCTPKLLMATHEEPREPCRRGDISATVGHTHLQGRTHRKRTLEASRGHKWTSRIRTSSVPGGHPRHDGRGTGTRRYQEGTREQYRGKPDWTGGKTKEELFSGSDRWHQLRTDRQTDRQTRQTDRQNSNLVSSPSHYAIVI